MRTYLHAICGQDDIQATNHTAGARDDRGRVIGAHAAIATVEWADLKKGAAPSSLPGGPAFLTSGYFDQPPGERYAALVQTTRNNRRFGASQRWRFFDTEAERNVYVRRRVANILARKG